MDEECTPESSMLVEADISGERCEESDFIDEGKERETSHVQTKVPVSPRTQVRSCEHNESFSGPDRRILKAFYTQYVAVLLIVLTFTVGAFQRTLHVPNTEQPPVKRVSPPIGKVSVEGLFDSGGKLVTEGTPLDAVAQLLRMHDVGVTVVVSVPRATIDGSDTAFQRGLRRVAQLERYFEAREVPSDAVTVSLVHGEEIDPTSFEFEYSSDG